MKKDKFQTTLHSNLFVFSLQNIFRGLEMQKLKIPNTIKKACTINFSLKTNKLIIGLKTVLLNLCFFFFFNGQKCYGTQPTIYNVKETNQVFSTMFQISLTIYIPLVIIWLLKKRIFGLDKKIFTELSFKILVSFNICLVMFYIQRMF